MVGNEMLFSQLYYEVCQFKDKYGDPELITLSSKAIAVLELNPQGNLWNIPLKHKSEYPDKKATIRNATAKSTFELEKL